MYKIAIYISNHGFGHASRMAALAEALIDFGQKLYICTNRPAWLFQNLPVKSFQYRLLSLDGGVKHKENLQVDYAATKAMLFKLFSQREALVANEAIWLRENKIDFVISDIPYFIIEAAGYAEVPVFGISNFDWFYIYAELFKDDAELKPLINTIYGLYKRLDKSYIPSFGDEQSVAGFPSSKQLGILAKKCVKKLPDKTKPRLLIMFGGEGGMEISFEAICEAWDGEVLSTNKVCKAENHVLITPDADFSCLVASADLIICKPGYSTFAEALNSGVPLIYLPRKNYPEEKQLIAGLKAYPYAVELNKPPATAEDWKKLFEKMPKVGKRRASENYQIAGLMLQDFIYLRAPKAKLMSVFDLGSNNLNYVLYDSVSDRIMNRAFITTALGMHFDGSKLDINHLDDILALKEILEADSKIQSEKHIIATGVMRKAQNAALLLEDLCDKWKLKGKIISAYQEMRLVWKAASKVIPPGKHALMIDIGGFSTELVWQSAGGAITGISLEIGLITLYKTMDYKSLIKTKLAELPEEAFDIIISVGLTTRLLSELIHSTVSKPEPTMDKINTNELHKLQEHLKEAADQSRQTQSLGIAANFLMQILDKFGHFEILVSADGISAGFARWKKKKK